jgi:HD-like signal output (HDOD) protein
MGRMVTQDEVVAMRDALPVFPRVIDDILATLDDPDANLNLLVGYVGRDPVLAGRVFSQANAAASHTRRSAAVRDLYTATSLIGLQKLRQTAITTSLAGFLHGALPAGLSPGFWEHSAATGVCAQQVASCAHQSADAPLIAGLLHDVGQLWLYRFEPQAFMAAWQDAVEHKTTIVEAERERFGVDHAVIGAWLAESWGLPPGLCQAILCHHAPDASLPDMLVATVHVAEVLSNALDVSGGKATRVTYLSAQACELLGLTWDESANALFGHIDAVSHFVATYFQPAPA